jgi:ABC-type glycerol-3-phosphate transport system permease component
VAAAYAISQSKWRIMRVIHMTLLLPLVVPIIITAVGIFFVLRADRYDHDGVPSRPLAQLIRPESAPLDLHHPLLFRATALPQMCSQRRSHSLSRAAVAMAGGR